VTDQNGNNLKKYISLLIAFVITILIYTSCGKTGDVGPNGTTGSQGLVGPAGPAGADGKAGSAIYSGSTVLLSSTGVAGDYYLDVATGLLYGPKTASGW